MYGGFESILWLEIPHTTSLHDITFCKTMTLISIAVNTLHLIKSRIRINFTCKPWTQHAQIHRASAATDIVHLMRGVSQFDYAILNFKLQI